MSKIIAERLASKKGKHAVDRLISYLLRADRFDEVDMFLQRHLRSLDTDVSRECQKLTINSVTLEGWDDLIAAIAKLPADEPCTALGLDLSDDSDGPEPAVQNFFYTNDCGFEFESASRADILALNRKYGTPWLGGFSEGGWELRFVGGSGVFKALKTYNLMPWDQRQSPEQLGSSILAVWLVFLRFNEAVIEKLRAQGLPSKMPVLLGFADGFGSFIETVHMSERVADHQATTDLIHAEQTADRKARFDKDTEDQIEHLTFLRRGLRSWLPFVNADKKALLIRERELQEQLLLTHFESLKSTSLAKKNTWKMSDSEFHSFIQAYREARGQMWLSRRG